MRSIEQIIADNGGDNTPAMDTHNLTGRAKCNRFRHDEHCADLHWGAAPHICGVTLSDGTMVQLEDAAALIEDAIVVVDGMAPGKYDCLSNHGHETVTDAAMCNERIIAND